MYKATENHQKQRDVQYKKESVLVQYLDSFYFRVCNQKNENHNANAEVKQGTLRFSARWGFLAGAPMEGR